MIIPPSLKWKTITPEEYKKIYFESIKNPIEFWAKEAEKLLWEKKWTQTINGKPPNTIWFKNGWINPYKNIIGKHKETWVWKKTAIIWEGENYQIKAITYSELDKLASKIASAIKTLNVNTGDWIMLYTPPTIEAIATTLASIKIGAPFEHIHTAFQQWELAKRILNRKPKIIIAIDEVMRRGKPIKTLETIRKAIEKTKHKCRLIVIERSGAPNLREKEQTLEEILKQSNTEIKEYTAPSQHPLFGLHTAYEEDFKPITHGTGGYLTQVYATTKWIGIKPRDTHFCTIWPSWITGVSYMIIGPLMIGTTIITYEGAPDYPSQNRIWEIIERYAVTTLLTTPGTLKTIFKNNNKTLEKHNIDTLKTIMTTGEPIEIEVWDWTYKKIGTGKTPLINSNPKTETGRIPVLNMYIQSEIGTFATGNLIDYTLTPIKPETAGPPIPGFHIEVIDENGNPTINSIGELAIKNPWPATPIQKPKEYLEKWNQEIYRTGDYAIIDNENYIKIIRRIDSVMKIHGYRISPGTIEKAIEEATGRKAIAIGTPDETRFEAPTIIVEENIEIEKIIREWITPIATPKEIIEFKEIPWKEKSKLRRKIREEAWKKKEEKKIIEILMEIMKKEYKFMDIDRYT